MQPVQLMREQHILRQHSTGTSLSPSQWACRTRFLQERQKRFIRAAQGACHAHAGRAACAAFSSSALSSRRASRSSSAQSLAASPRPPWRSSSPGTAHSCASLTSTVHPQQGRLHRYCQCTALSLAWGCMRCWRGKPGGVAAARLPDEVPRDVEQRAPHLPGLPPPAGTGCRRSCSHPITLPPPGPRARHRTGHVGSEQPLQAACRAARLS